MNINTDTGPFAIIPEWLLDAEVSDRAVRLYAILARHADKVSGEAIPSRARLGERLRCSRDSIDRATKELEEAGAVAVEARFDAAGDRTSNRYTVFRVRQGGREGAATGTSTGAATGGRGGAAQNESPLNESHLNENGKLSQTINPFAGGVRVGRETDPKWAEMDAELTIEERNRVGLAALAALRAVAPLEEEEPNRG